MLLVARENELLYSSRVREQQYRAGTQRRQHPERNGRHIFHLHFGDAVIAKLELLRSTMHIKIESSARADDAGSKSAGTEKHVCSVYNCVAPGLLLTVVYSMLSICTIPHWKRHDDAFASDITKTCNNAKL